MALMFFSFPRKKTNKLYGVPENLDNKEKHAVLSVRLSIFFLLKLNTLFFLKFNIFKDKIHSGGNLLIVSYFRWTKLLSIILPTYTFFLLNYQ